MQPFFYEFVGPIFSGSLRYNQDSNLRLNVRSAKFVEALITDSSLYGFNNDDNIKPGHRNIYINGGQDSQYCDPLGDFIHGYIN